MLELFLHLVKNSKKLKIFVAFFDYFNIKSWISFQTAYWLSCSYINLFCFLFSKLAKFSIEVDTLQKLIKYWLWFDIS